MKINTIIAVAGGTASGKTTVAKKIIDVITDDSVTLISTDNYYNDYSNLNSSERKQINYDHPNSIDLDLLVEHLYKLSHNEPVKQYVYDFTHNIRTKKTITIKPSKVIILEGILILAIKEIRELADIKIFIKTDDDIRFIRRFERDIKERKRSAESIINQYLLTVKPMHDLLVEPSVKYADLIVPYYEGNIVAIDMILSKIKTLIKAEKKKGKINGKR